MYTGAFVASVTTFLGAKVVVAGGAGVVFARTGAAVVTTTGLKLYLCAT